MAKVDLKVVLLGQQSVGKTTLVDRYINGTFTNNAVATVGAAFAAKKISIGNQVLTLGIWDTAGGERYEAMSRIYYRSARAACVCFDLTNALSFKKLKFWVDELLTNEEECSVYIIGTKWDLVSEGKAPRAVEQSEVSHYVESIKAKYCETSSKTGEGIDALFSNIASDWLLRSISGGSDVRKAVGPSVEIGKEETNSCRC
eukprot:TRINITY_DN10242_c0_g2_i1.p1 TRINITY_DN10242_c0_g2~~TRINITY_DN10242_c0_g2_i1.p1  ORF type:complete len:215 (-),score=38.16 TRINITY_DN10242_c0_g2_i1:180-782(-)